MGVNGHWYVEIEKQGYWRGNQHTWVNRYVMSGDTPGATDAQAVITALKGIENSIYGLVDSGAGVGFVGGFAYGSGKGAPFVSTFYNESKAAATATGFSGTGGAYSSIYFGATLEGCMLVETPLQGLSSSGKPVYLRKFMRGFGVNNGEALTATPINAADLTRIAGYTLPWRTGMGASNWVVIGNNGGQSAGPPTVRNYLANRQVPKGRKKKKTSGDLLSEILTDAAKARALATAAAESIG